MQVPEACSIRLRYGTMFAHLQAGEGGHVAAAHGGPGDSNGLRHIKHCHGSLQDAWVQVQSILGNALPEPRRVRKVLRLKLLVPPVYGVKPILPKLLISAGAHISATVCGEVLLTCKA